MSTDTVPDLVTRLCEKKFAASVDQLLGTCDIEGAAVLRVLPKIGNHNIYNLRLLYTMPFPLSVLLWNPNVSRWSLLL